MITTLSGAGRSYHGRKINVGRTTTYKLEIFCDGVASKWNANLANNEIWIDASVFYRQGINLSPSLQYSGAGSCAVSGSLENRRIVQDLKGEAGPAIVTAMSTQWDSVGNLVPGTPLNMNMQMYEVLKLVFSNNPGHVTIVCV